MVTSDNKYFAIETSVIKKTTLSKEIDFMRRDLIEGFNHTDENKYDQLENRMSKKIN